MIQIENLFAPAVGDRDSDDLRQNSSALFPSESYVTFLRNATVMKLIGAEVRASREQGMHRLTRWFGQARYSECAGSVGNQFSRTGDDARTLLPQLGALVNSGLKTLIWVRAILALRSA